MSREADLLEAMRYANLDEQRRITAELEQLRSRRTAATQADRATDLGVQVARDHLTPVFVHGQHTAATDWLDEVAPSFNQVDIKKIDRQVRAEAASWFNHTSKVIREYPDEFAEQARGVASRTASQFGVLAPQVSDLFLRHVASLYRVAEGTDLAGVPSASDSTGNPDATEWGSSPDVLPPADSGSLDAPEGLDASPDAPAPDGGPGESNPSDQAPSSSSPLPAEDTLDVTDSNNAAGSTQSGIEAGRKKPSPPLNCGHGNPINQPCAQCDRGERMMMKRPLRRRVPSVHRLTRDGTTGMSIPRVKVSTRTLSTIMTGTRKAPTLTSPRFGHNRHAFF